MFSCTKAVAVPEQTADVAAPQQTAMAAPQDTMTTAPQQVMGHPQGDSTLAMDLGNCNKLCVKQEFSMLEMIGFGAKNRYRICKDLPEAEGGKTFLYVKEDSKFIERKCLSSCRTFSLAVHAGVDTSGPVVLTMTKDLHCPMTPCPMMALDCGIISGLKALGALQKPPELTLWEGDTILGTVVDPPCAVFHCQMDASIRNAQGEEVFHLGPKSMFSKGMYCPCCAEERMPITREGKMVAEIVRIQLSCAELYGKCNRFEIEFGEVTDPTERKLILGAAFLLDMQYWDQKE
jgi:hypothetical protein